MLFAPNLHPFHYLSTPPVPFLVLFPTSQLLNIALAFCRISHHRDLMREEDVQVWWE
jgi:hypothetical protein